MAESHHTPSEVEEQEPEVIRDPTMTWILGIGIALAIVLAFWVAGLVNTRAGQAWAVGTGPKGELLTGATPAGNEDLGLETPGSPSSGGRLSPTVGPPEGSASSGRGTVPTPPGPGGNALPASPAGAAGAIHAAIGAMPARAPAAVAGSMSAGAMAVGATPGAGLRGRVPATSAGATVGTGAPSGVVAAGGSQSGGRVGPRMGGGAESGGVAGPLGSPATSPAVAGTSRGGGGVTAPPTVRGTAHP